MSPEFAQTCFYLGGCCYIAGGILLAIAGCLQEFCTAE